MFRQGNNTLSRSRLETDYEKEFMDYTVKIKFNKYWWESWLIIDNEQELTIEQYLNTDKNHLMMFLEDKGFDEFVYTSFDFYGDTQYDLIVEPFSTLERAVECRELIKYFFEKSADYIVIEKGE